jgi:putative thioredoxin
MTDVTDATFQTAVVERSDTVPVVVDLWAEWCGPCKQLGPVLEQVVAGTNGAVELAKVDVDTNPQVAQAFQVQSIPAVYAMRDGKIVDGFLGAQPEWQVQEFVDKLLAPVEESEVDKLLAAGDEASLRAALELEPADDRVITALASVLATDGRGEDALVLLEKVPETAETRRIAALARTGADAGGDIETRLTSLLDRVKDDDAARQEYVDLLELLADEDAKGPWRRQLSARLF